MLNKGIQFSVASPLNDIAHGGILADMEIAFSKNHNPTALFTGS